jgi:2-keto-4-pentenoate hydratase/2-oxohepta-3-ene-1,7-dioic acid hydratase in catechol pathway
MKLVRFSYDRKTYWGKYDSASQNIYTSLKATENLDSFQKVIDFFTTAERDKHIYPDVIPKADVELLAPVLPTKNILCIGKNYYDHILEFDGSAEDAENAKENPIFFSKAISAITGPFSPILLHMGVTNAVDYEAELAVVIGKRGINITKENALKHVYGYTILNDVTARDLQKIHQQWLKGKSLDTHCPIGPWLVTADEIADPQNLSIKSIVNGEVRQDSNTKLMMQDVADLIEVLSCGMTLDVGDVIATGTPKGVGMGFNPPKFLQNGDRVEIVIEKIGSLVNPVK